MQRRGERTWTTRLVTGIALCAAVLAVTECRKSPTAPTKVAAADVTVSLTRTTVAAAEGVTFSFSSGGEVLSPALAGQAFTLTFTNTSSATPTTTVVSGGHQFVASTAFGSCDFTVQSSTIPGITAGTVITVDPCRVVAKTGGIEATGQATTVQILLKLGLGPPSAPAQAQVTIDPVTGTVTINGVNTGQTVTLTVNT